MRQRAEVEAVPGVAPAIHDGERADGDGERFERGGRTVRRRFTGEHTRDVVLERYRADVVAAACPRDPDAQRHLAWARGHRDGWRRRRRHGGRRAG